MTALCVLWTIAEYRNGQTNTDSEGVGDLLLGLTLGWVLILALFVGPGFWSGVLYVRQREQSKQLSDHACRRPHTRMRRVGTDVADGDSRAWTRRVETTDAVNL
jgi:hypothetical protein